MQSAGSQFALADRLSADLYRTNAFRVTGLAAEATDREISRHMERLRMARRLGTALPEAATPLRLTPPPTLEAVAEAAQRLRDPDTRLVDRFFWFWGGDPISDHALTLLRDGNVVQAAGAWRQASRNGHQPVPQHNLAVLFHATAIDLEHETEARQLSDAEETRRGRLWQEALLSWRILLGLDDFWALWERMAQADSAMAAGLAADFRTGLPCALLTINAELAVSASRGLQGQPRALAHRALLETSGFDASAIEFARRRAVQPLMNSIASLCKQTEAAAVGEPSRGREAVTRLLADAAGPLANLATVLPGDHALLNAAAGEVLSAARGPLVSYANSTRDWSGVLPLVTQCFNLPSSAAARDLWEKDVAAVISNIVVDHTETVAKGGTTPRQALASLSSLAKWIDDVRRAGYVSGRASADLYDNVAQAACAVSIVQFKSGDLSGASETLKFALTFAKSGETRAQITQGLEAIASRRRRSSSNAAAGWIFLGLIGLGVLSSIFGSSKRTTTSSGGTRPPAVRSQGSQMPQAGNRAQVALLEGQINHGRALIAQHERALAQFDRSLSGTKTEIEGYNAEIEQMEREAQAGLYVDRSRYELLVATQNEAVERHNATLALRRTRYTQYQEALRETNAKIDQHNRLIR